MMYIQIIKIYIYIQIQKAKTKTSRPCNFKKKIALTNQMRANTNNKPTMKDLSMPYGIGSTRIASREKCFWEMVQGFETFCEHDTAWVLTGCFSSATPNCDYVSSD